MELLLVRRQIASPISNSYFPSRKTVNDRKRQQPAPSGHTIDPQQTHPQLKTWLPITETRASPDISPALTQWSLQRHVSSTQSVNDSPTGPSLSTSAATSLGPPSPLPASTTSHSQASSVCSPLSQQGDLSGRKVIPLHKTHQLHHGTKTKDLNTAWPPAAYLSCMPPRSSSKHSAQLSFYSSACESLTTVPPRRLSILSVQGLWPHKPSA